MASDKKRKKLGALDRKARKGATTSKDGDRRRRPTTDLVRQELERKRLERDWTIDGSATD